MTFKESLKWRFKIWKRAALMTGPRGFRKDLDDLLDGLWLTADSLGSLLLGSAMYLILLPISLPLLPLAALIRSRQSQAKEPPCNK